MDFTQLYVEVDDFWARFCGAYHQRLIAHGQRRRAGHRRSAIAC